MTAKLSCKQVTSRGSWKPAMRRQIPAEALRKLAKSSQILSALSGRSVSDNSGEGATPIKYFAQRGLTTASSTFTLLAKLGINSDRPKAHSYVTFARETTEFWAHPTCKGEFSSALAKHYINILHNFAPNMTSKDPIKTDKQKLQLGLLSMTSAYANAALHFRRRSAPQAVRRFFSAPRGRAKEEYERAGALRSKGPRQTHSPTSPLIKSPESLRATSFPL